VINGDKKWKRGYSLFLIKLGKVSSEILGCYNLADIYTARI
jgi:hypothetical protein